MIPEYGKFKLRSGIRFLAIYAILILYFQAVFIKECRAQNSWLKRLPGVGTFSSPHVADLNSDGVKDIILGVGRQEFHACDSSVIALDGMTGDLIWKVQASDQIFGSATLKDITNDGVVDVFISGRSAELIAIDGRTGHVIWRFKTPRNQKKEWYNFYNPQFIPDQN